jgi:hypothetical protein
MFDLAKIDTIAAANETVEIDLIVPGGDVKIAVLSVNSGLSDKVKAAFSDFSAKFNAAEKAQKGSGENDPAVNDAHDNLIVSKVRLVNGKEFNQSEFKQFISKNKWAILQINAASDNLSLFLKKAGMI